MSQTIAQLTFSLPHIELAALRFGQPDKPVLLALHGWLDNAMSFAPLAAQLTDWQIVAVEWPGHGLSQHRPGKTPLHWVDYLLDLHQLLAALNADGVKIQALLGHSLGGLVASAYCALYPDNVPRLILLEALGPLFEAQSNIRQRLIKSLDGHSQPVKARSVYPEIDTVVKARRKLTGLAEPFCRLIIERNMERCESGFKWRTDARLRLDSPVRFSFEQVDTLMTQVTTPTLLLIGEQGYRQLHQSQPLMETWYRDFTHRILDGDHHLHMGNASGVASAVRGFLAD